MSCPVAVLVLPERTWLVFGRVEACVRWVAYYC